MFDLLCTFENLRKVTIRASMCHDMEINALHKTLRLGGINQLTQHTDVKISTFDRLPTMSRITPTIIDAAYFKNCNWTCARGEAEWKGGEPKYQLFVTRNNGDTLYTSEVAESDLPNGVPH